MTLSIRQELLATAWDSLHKGFDTRTARGKARKWWAKDLPVDDGRASRTPERIHVLVPYHVMASELEAAAESSYADLLDQLADGGLREEEGQVVAALAKNAVHESLPDLPAMVTETERRFRGLPSALWISASTAAQHSSSKLKEIQDNAARRDIAVRQLTSDVDQVRAIAFPIGNDRLWRTRVRELGLAWDFDDSWESIVLVARAQYRLNWSDKFQALTFL